MEILPYSKDRQDEIMSVEKLYEEKYPLAESFDVSDLKNPLLMGEETFFSHLMMEKSSVFRNSFRDRTSRINTIITCG